MGSRTLLLAVVVAAATAFGLYALLRTKPAELEEPPTAAPEGAQGKPRSTALITGTLVVRVRTSDGKPLPADAVAGYRDGRDPRLRPISPEGTVRFSDVPLREEKHTRLEALAQASGYFPAAKEVLLARDLANEAVLTLTAAP